MKKILSAVLLFLTLTFAPTFAATTPTPKPESAPSVVVSDAEFRQNLTDATLALYHAKETCGWQKVSFDFFGSQIVSYDWTCKFVEHFTCTATVIDSIPSEGGKNGYIAVTAGHCFDESKIEEYYVGDAVTDKPVLYKVAVQKFENDDRYDYGVITFEAAKRYPVIDIGSPDAELPPVGTDIYNSNFSLGVVKELVEGKITSKVVQSTEGGLCGVSCRGRFFVSIFAGPGASGSAIIDPKTQTIVGFVEAYFPGTIMPMVGIPAGKNLAAFLADDSAGIQPLPPVGEPPQDPDLAPRIPTTTALDMILAVLGLGIGGGLLIGHEIRRAKIKLDSSKKS